MSEPSGHVIRPKSHPGAGWVTVKVTTNPPQVHITVGGAQGLMSVTLINIFEVPAGDEDEFIAAWEKTRDYLKTFPAHIETALHQSLHDTQFRFVNIAHWTSEDEFNAAVGSQGFREAASELHWPFHPALYQVVRTA